MIADDFDVFSSRRDAVIMLELAGKKKENRVKFWHINFGKIDVSYISVQIERPKSYRAQQIAHRQLVV